MGDDLIPGGLRDFILKYFDSIAQLEALLLLRENPGRTWTAAQLAQRLYIDAQDAGKILERLCADGLLACEDDIYHYQCADRNIQSMVDALAAVYARHIVPVTNIIHSKPRRIQEFADAFRIKKDR